MIQAKVIADSIGQFGDRLTTLEVIMPRYILAEFNTHRVSTKNSASSRAIPFNKMIKSLLDSTFIPYAFQKEHTGMQGFNYVEDKTSIQRRIDQWIYARDLAILSATKLYEPLPNNIKEQDNNAIFEDQESITKQLCNRILEPFIYHKVLVSGTEWNNFFNLRCPQYCFEVTDEHDVVVKSRKEMYKAFPRETHILDKLTTLDWLKRNKGQADIHMMFLAEAIYDAINESNPKELKEGEWHIPYRDNIDLDITNWTFLPNHNDLWGKDMTEYIIKISIARCARLSYQTLGDNPVIDYKKDLELYEVLSKSGHWSPFEHVAKVMNEKEYYSFIKGEVRYDHIEEEIVSIKSIGFNKPKDNSVYGWCNNFKGFIQERYLLEQNYV